MALDTSLHTLNEQQDLLSRVSILEKERDFIKELYTDLPRTLSALAKGIDIGELVASLKNKIQTQLNNTYCIFLMCDKDCLQWSLQQPDNISANLLGENGQLTNVPQALLTFAASPSCPKRHDSSIQKSADWSGWSAFFKEHDFSDVSMASVPDSRGVMYIMMVFQSQDTLVDSGLMELVLDYYTAGLKAAFEREKADHLLLEDSHRDPATGLLRRYSFQNSFGMVLKDSRRNFQRVALISVRLLSTSTTIDVNELKELAQLLQETVRDNDLIAHYDDKELVVGIRIQHLEDAEVVAKKILKSLQSSDLKSNRLIKSGVTLGVSFYPEHSNLDDLHQAAYFASSALQTASGVRLEFHGNLYESSADFYSA